MQKTALVIMAAGMGSRYGGIKQIEPVGPGGEIILDYSVYDALEAGFNRVVLIIRRDIEKEFRAAIGERLEKKVEVEYVFQDMEDLPEGFSKPEGRVKPWGTGHAVLCCRDVIREPFIVINADDYYGKESFAKIHEELCKAREIQAKHRICMAGFCLGNTLSENGSVTRGICQVEDGKLMDIVETKKIIKKDGSAWADGRQLPLDQPVSMNMWGFMPEMIPELSRRFVQFLSAIPEGDLTAEYLLPEIVQSMLKDGECEVQVLKTGDHWFGVTYKEDKPFVVESFRKLTDQGVYPKCLYS